MFFTKKQNNIIKIIKKSINFACLNIQKHEQANQNPRMLFRPLSRFVNGGLGPAH